MLRPAFAVGVLVLLPTFAAADQTGLRMNEIMLSHNGDGTAQFLELEDTSGIAFNTAGLGIRVYDSTGAQTGFQPMTFSGAVTRVIFASASARTPAHFDLQTTTNPPTVILNLQDILPAAGTACFRQSGVDLHCMAWGSPANHPMPDPTNGTVPGEAPMDNQSLQRQATCAALGPHTLGMTNAVIACPSVGPDGGVQPDAGGGGGNEGDDSCSTTRASSLSLVGIVLVLVRRRRR
jgi:hypothetical protein